MNIEYQGVKREVDDLVFEGFKNKTKSQIFKLLPLREEKGEWEKHLDATITELMGAKDVFPTINFLRVICKMAELRYLDFKYYRKTIFEIMNLVEVLDKEQESGE